jgi:hypothetical protein
MPLSVAESTQGNQVCHCIAAEPAPRFQMMNLQIVEGTTLLAPPTVSIQYLIAQSRVLIRAQFNSGTFLSHIHQHPLWLILRKNNTGKKVSADHLEAVAPRFVGTQHQSRSFKSPLNYG